LVAATPSKTAKALLETSKKMSAAVATVYTLPACVQCDSTKRLLTRENIEFNVVDLSQDAQALEMIQALGYTAAPVVIAGEEHWSGFKMDKILALKN
jgi:glutaredoxin-like protein NrdH